VGADEGDVPTSRLDPVGPRAHDGRDRFGKDAEGREEAVREISGGR
jgi:hypothetical protein